MAFQDPTSNYDPEWVARQLAKNPCFEAPADAANSGNIRTCPVRLSFPYLFKAQAPMEQGREPKYAVTCLFPMGADLTVLRAAASRVALEKWPNLGQPGGIQPAQLHTPFKDQGDKAQWGGYSPGAICITASSERKPPVVDARLAPITDEALIYPGVWAFVTLRPFAFETRNPQGAVVKRGISFGLQSVMRLVDDQDLGGASGDPTSDFAGVQIEGLASDIDPGQQFANAAGGEVTKASVFG